MLKYVDFHIIVNIFSYFNNLFRLFQEFHVGIYNHWILYVEKDFKIWCHISITSLKLAEQVRHNLKYQSFSMVSNMSILSASQENGGLVTVNFWSVHKIIKLRTAPPSELIKLSFIFSLKFDFIDSLNLCN